jgi:CRISPR-associated protein Cas1
VPILEVYMHQLLNTLYITTPEAYVRLDHETLRVEVEGETKLQVPLHHLGALVCFGDVLISPAVLHRCADDGRSVVLLDRNGRFKGRLEGPVSGNVLLRKAQHEAVNDPHRTLSVARNIVAGKIQNTRQIVLRAAREAEGPEDGARLKDTAEALAATLEQLATTENLDQLRGFEGEAARRHFSTFSSMVREDRETFQFSGRSRRPPRDPINALLSFLYALLLSDCVAAAEGVGLDPQMGFLHTLRPGRPALGLDLMEELRSAIAERLTLTLINRRQVTAKHFVTRPGGAVYLNDEGRKEVIVAYQKRKQEEVLHPVLEQKVPVGLILHVQARLLARVLRGDMEAYLPFLYR